MQDANSKQLIASIFAMSVREASCAVHHAPSLRYVRMSGHGPYPWIFGPRTDGWKIAPPFQSSILLYFPTAPPLTARSLPLFGDRLLLESPWQLANPSPHF